MELKLDEPDVPVLGAAAAEEPALVADLAPVLPRIAASLGVTAAIVARLGPAAADAWLMLLFSDRGAAAQALDSAGAVRPSFALAADWQRLQRQQDQHARLRTLILAFTRSLASTLDMGAALAELCEALEPLFGAARAAAWIHDRRARQIVLEATSDPAGGATGTRIDVEARETTAVRALRSDHPALVAAGRGAATLLVPLRGRRRALGALVIEGVAVAAGGESDPLGLAEELARQLSTAIENMLLFEEILRSRRELENTFNSLVDLVVVCDRALRIVHANRAFAERIGVARERLFERPLAEFASPETAAWISSLARLTAEADAVTREGPDTLLRGIFSMTVSTLRTQDGQPIGLVLVARDVTRQAELEAERAALGERLAQSEKLAALGQFVAGIAHELNNPLQGVLGHLELLRGRRSLPRAFAPEIRLIYREADRAAKIVNNLLVFAGSRRAARRRVNPNAALRRALALRARACREAGIDIIRALDDRVPPIVGDALLLQQALLNIVINAEQAIVAAAEVSSRRPGRPRIEAKTTREAGRVVIEIRDTGPGIPPDVLPRIFEPFFTTKEVGKGTGLGLALTYGIIQEHGGAISVRNHPSGGAAFRIELPETT
jgi:PAS domain S-box-containing protein